MKNELVDIIQIESATPMSWYDWWSYWSTIVFIGLFVSICFLLTMSYYSLRGTKETDTAIIPIQQSSPNVDSLVATILHQNHLTL
jgi:hypothetical protein